MPAQPHAMQNPFLEENCTASKGPCGFSVAQRREMVRARHPAAAGSAAAAAAARPARSAAGRWALPLHPHAAAASRDARCRLAAASAAAVAAAAGLSARAAGAAAGSRLPTEMPVLYQGGSAMRRAGRCRNRPAAALQRCLAAAQQRTWAGPLLPARQALRWGLAPSPGSLAGKRPNQARHPRRCCPA